MRRKHMWAIALVFGLGSLLALEVWTLGNETPEDSLTSFVLGVADRWTYGRTALALGGFAIAGWWAFHIRRKPGPRR